MQHFDRHLILSPTDLVGFLGCAHLTELDLAASSGMIAASAVEDDETLAVVQARGLEHEAKYLASLRGQGLRVTEIAAAEGGAIADLTERAEATGTALRDGTDIVFQATFFDGDPSYDNVMWRGHADFLRRVATPSDLGNFSYEPEDTKLARHVKAGAILQLCSYAEQLASVQGVAPENIHVVLGGGVAPESVRLKDVAAYYRVTRRRFLTHLLDTHEPTYPLPVAHCTVCRWTTACDQRWIDDDHLSQVANLSSIQTRKLALANVGTMTALATSAVDLRVPRIGARTLNRLRDQARLQIARELDGPPPYEFVTDGAEGQGFQLLPEPDGGDIFYDIEGDPYVGLNGLEYLHGLSWFEDGTLRFDPIWAHDEAAEKAGFERLIDFFIAQLRQFPKMHIYHYAPYETAALKRLMGRYGTRENELDELFRGEVFVDLYRVVRQALIVGSPSYSLKKLEPLYMPRREDAIVDAGSSIVQYEAWIESRDQQILDDIEQYNKVDVESTYLLREWLEQRRVEAEAAGINCSRLAPPKPYVQPEESVALDEHDAELTSALLNLGIPEGQLMADLLRWHEREDKPEWWAYFDRVEADDEELFDNAEAIVGLVQHGEPTVAKSSLVWTYAFDPLQECKLAKGSSVADPAIARHNLHADDDNKIPNETAKILSLDPVAGLLTFKRGSKSIAPPPKAFVATGPIPNKQQRRSIQRVASAVVQHSIDVDGPALAARQLLGRRLPRTTAPSDGSDLVVAGETATDAVVRVGQALDGSYLAVQGPPGSGKTYAGAQLIASLVENNRTVGITANGHAVITNILKEALHEIAKRGLPAPVVLQKGPDDDEWTPPAGVTAASNDEIVAAFGPDTEARPAIVAGTAWLWSREGLVDTVDTLIIDEAGQFSLANALAVAPVARNLVLLGDPQQLAQPSKGVHPPGAGVSALEHVLGEHTTIPTDAGVFLDRTFRMHPDITAFVSEQVYEDRLASVDECANQRIGGEGALSGVGLRFRPVDHEGNATQSDEEVAEVVRIFDDLRGRTWIDSDENETPIGLDQILIVAPYNAQVNSLIAALPAGARVGTVDKFQGQQAAAVIVSMTASAPANISRGMEFLYSRNRLNVAVSRAKALSVLVASPQLLAVNCRTVEQMRLANVLCRYVEMATS